MEQGQPSTPQPPAESGAAPSQPESAAVPAETAAPAPAPEESTETLKAEIERLKGEVHQRNVTIGNQGAELGELRTQAQQPAEPAPSQPSGGYGELVFSDDPDAAFQKFEQDLQVDERAQQAAVQAVQQLRHLMEFERANPDLVGKDVARAQAISDIGERALRGMDHDTGMKAIADKTRELLSTNVSQEAAPTPPPLAPATAPTQAPTSPAEAAPAPYDPDVEAAKAADEERERLLKHQTVASSLRVPGGGS